MISSPTDKFCLRGGLALLPVLLVIALTSCKPTDKSSPPKSDNKQAVRPARVIAQGQIQPASGLIRLNGTPGDAVESIKVALGQPVNAGDVLITLRSHAARESQVEMLKQQLSDAQLQQTAAIERAEIELSAARMQLKLADQQATSIKNRRPSIELLKQQWQDAQAALRRVEAISQDPLTKAMVSRLEIDKQRASVTAAQLQYQSQQETIDQADLSASSGKELAQEKVRAAEKALDLAKRIDPAAVLKAQIASAEQQLALSKLVSPIDGTVVSLEARVGESIAQYPLIQVADLTRMVCQVEIYQTDAPLVQIGQKAEMRSDAFKKPLRGKVARIDRLIGFPQLRATDPLAKTDYRTLPVQVEIDGADAAVAAHWVQLQVEVTIPLDSTGS